jgi:hypothetical protein
MAHVRVIDDGTGDEGPNLLDETTIRIGQRVELQRRFLIYLSMYPYA